MGTVEGLREASTVVPDLSSLLKVTTLPSQNRVILPSSSSSAALCPRHAVPPAGSAPHVLTDRSSTFSVMRKPWHRCPDAP